MFVSQMFQVSKCLVRKGNFKLFFPQIIYSSVLMCECKCVFNVFILYLTHHVSYFSFIFSHLFQVCL